MSTLALIFFFTLNKRRAILLDSMKFRLAPLSHRRHIIFPPRAANFTCLEVMTLIRSSALTLRTATRLILVRQEGTSLPVTLRSESFALRSVLGLWKSFANAAISSSAEVPTAHAQAVDHMALIPSYPRRSPLLANCIFCLQLFISWHDSGSIFFHSPLRCLCWFP